MDMKQREIVQKLVEDGIVRPPTMSERTGIEIRVDNSLPDNVWVMNDLTRMGLLKFLWHQRTIAQRMKRMRLVDVKNKETKQ